MVMQDKRWDITAIPAASEVSLPRAAGITIVLRPKGIASEHRPHINAVCEKGINFAAIINITGKIISLTIDTI